MVDDNATNLELLGVRLNTIGYEVFTAMDGEEALTRATISSPIWSCSTS